MLELVGLHKRYGDVVALDGCTFEVGRGRMLGFLGPNGAGKTTAMRAIFGLAGLDGGEVRWDGHTITDEDRRRGTILAKDRQGNVREIPLMTLSIGCVSNVRRSFVHPAKVSELASEMKSYAKSFRGSVYVVDRRRDDGGETADTATGTVGRGATADANLPS